jgi:hypothetical protein
MGRTALGNVLRAPDVRMVQQRAQTSGVLRMSTLLLA